LQGNNFHHSADDDNGGEEQAYEHHDIWRGLGCCSYSILAKPLILLGVRECQWEDVVFLPTLGRNLRRFLDVFGVNLKAQQSFQSPVYLPDFTIQSFFMMFAAFATEWCFFRQFLENGGLPFRLDSHL
jgi:hypothetical protein